MATQTSIGRYANFRPYHLRASAHPGIRAHPRTRARAHAHVCRVRFFLGREFVVISHLQVSFFREGMVQARISEDVPKWRPCIWQFAIDQDR